MMRLIIYDLDGTLADTKRDITDGANHMRRAFGKPPLSEEIVGRFVGQGVYALVGNCLETEDSRQIEKGIKIYREYYGRHMLDHTRLYPGALEALNYFRERKQAVMTNKPNPFSREILVALGVGDFFCEIVAGDSQFPKKPDPEALFFLMERERSAPNETLFIGDSAIDIETGRRAGIQVAVVSHGFGTQDELQSARPDVLAKDFPALLKMAQDKGW